MIQDFNYNFNLGTKVNAFKKLKGITLEKVQNEITPLNQETDDSPKIPKKMPPKEMEADFIAMVNKVKHLPPQPQPVPVEEQDGTVSDVQEESLVDNSCSDVGKLIKPSVHLTILQMTQYSLSELINLGLTEEDVERYFAALYSEDSKPVSYMLLNDVIGGRKVKTIEEAVDAITDVKIEEISTKLYKEYKEGNLNFSDLKQELEKAGAKDIQYRPLPDGRLELVFTINGKQSGIINNRPDFETLTTIDRDENGKITYHVTAEGVEASLDDYPAEGTYATKDYLTILCGFGDSIIDKYFTPTVIQKEACGVRYVLNDDIVINGKHIKTINALRIALLLQSVSGSGILPLDS